MPDARGRLLPCFPRSSLSSASGRRLVGERSCGHPEQGAAWAASPGASARHRCGHGWDQHGAEAEPSAGRGRGSRRSGGHGQQQAGGAGGEAAEERGHGQDPPALASPAALPSFIRCHFSAYQLCCPEPQREPSPKPQISARQRLKAPEIKSARARGQAWGIAPQDRGVQGWEPVAGCARGTPAGAPHRCAFPRRHLRQRERPRWGRRCQRGRRAAGERLTLTAKGHFAPGSVGDGGSTAPPARLVPSPFHTRRFELLSPFQVMPKPRRRPWPGAVLGHPSCCGSPSSCSSARAVSGVRPVPQACAPRARPACPDRPWPRHTGAAAGGWERRWRGGRWQDGAWRVPGLPNARLFLSSGWGARLREEALVPLSCLGTEDGDGFVTAMPWM